MAHAHGILLWESAKSHQQPTIRALVKYALTALTMMEMQKQTAQMALAFQTRSAEAHLLRTAGSIKIMTHVLPMHADGLMILMVHGATSRELYAGSMTATKLPAPEKMRHAIGILL